MTRASTAGRWSSPCHSATASPPTCTTAERASRSSHDTGNVTTPKRTPPPALDDRGAARTDGPALPRPEATRAHARRRAPIGSGSSPGRYPRATGGRRSRSMLSGTHDRRPAHHRPDQHWTPRPAMPTPAGPPRPFPAPADRLREPWADQPHPGGRRRRRALAAVGALLVVAALGGGAFTARQLAGRPDRQAVAIQTGSGRQPAPAGAATQPAAPLGPRLLAVTSHPAGATLTIEAAGGSTRRVRTPFRGMVPGGELALSLTRPGYNRLDHHLPPDRARTLEFWLDPAGLLHHDLGSFSTGSNPNQAAFTPDSRQIWGPLLGGHGVQVFSAGSRRLLHQIRLGQHGAAEVVFTTDGRTAYASQMETASVFEIDTATYRVRRQLATKGNWSKVMAL